MLRLRFSIPAILIALVAISYSLLDPHLRAVREMRMDELCGYPFDQQQGRYTDIPVDIRMRDGTTIEIEGDMWQPTSTSGGAMCEFQLTDLSQRTNDHCPPQIQWFIHARIPPGKLINYSPSGVRVIGVLHVNLTHDEDGRITSVYQIDVEDVKPVAPQTWFQKLSKRIRF